MEQMDSSTLLVVSAGDQLSLRMSRQIAPLLLMLLKRHRETQQKSTENEKTSQTMEASSAPASQKQRSKRERRAC
jgi:hypothetical protein